MAWIAQWGFWQWLILGFILLIAETILPGIFLLWFGIAGLCLALVTALFPIPVTLSWILFAILACSLSLLWWYYQHKKDQIEDRHTPLNQRGLAMIGKMGIVIELNPNGIGRGQFGDTTWRIQGPYLSNGDTIRVVDIDGITLHVEKIIS